ncbi:hypothetical protein CYMTET_38167 [Cymbomonas tetramitiformis]|uniref:Fe2OG dioxygenase domain-containing protein n=1 Tax=Cymbomonas tetramitiformis TaxID=36881 RepID=A0AAE0F5H2_9CHLO|nr:hypothetical protein CYMTET_38167 [Cymbomonas tetramitiformis]
MYVKLVTILLFSLPHVTRSKRLPSGNTSCAITDSIIKYTYDRISNSTVRKYPYEYTIVEEVFEPSFYEKCILPYFPSAKSHIFSKQGARERYSVRMKGTEYSGLMKGKNMDSEVRKLDAFWKNMTDAFAGDYLQNLWIQKFEATLTNRFPDLSNQLAKERFYYRWDLASDRTGYEISPHTDSIDKLITILFYLPKGDTYKSFGTTVYESRDGLDDGGFMRTYENPNWRKQFVAVERGPFVPNTVFAFAPCQSSWHGVENVAGKAVHRDTIQSFITIKSQMKMAKPKKGLRRALLARRCAAP